MQEEASNPKVRVSTSAVWNLDLNALEQTALSIKELGFRPILTKGELQDTQPHLLKVEETQQTWIRLSKSLRGEE